MHIYIVSCFTSSLLHTSASTPHMHASVLSYTLSRSALLYRTQLHMHMAPCLLARTVIFDLPSMGVEITSVSVCVPSKEGLSSGMTFCSCVALCLLRGRRRGWCSRLRLRLGTLTRALGRWLARWIHVLGPLEGGQLVQIVAVRVVVCD